VPSSANLPSYEPMLAAYHHAFAAELEAMVGTLPIREGDQVLEMACGDGAYSPWLARRVGPTGALLAVDIAPQYLAVARAKSSRSPVAARVAHVAADIRRLPLPRGSFDLVWCAQSLYSLPDQLAAMSTMADLARPGGTVAVLEDDTIHQLVLPWPPDVELAVRAAELEAFADETGSSRKYYVGRRLGSLFREAGLAEVRARAFASTRQAPLDAPVRAFLAAYLDELRDRVVDRLPQKIRDRFMTLVDPSSPDGLLDSPDLILTCLDHVVSGVRPR